MGQRLTVGGKLNLIWGRRRETESEQGVQSPAVDPKPGELSMARVKAG